MTSFEHTIGSPLLVYRGKKHHTKSGLTENHLMKYKGRVVSKKKHKQGMKAIKRLKKLGYKAKKGTFKLFQKGGNKTEKNL